MKIRTNYVSNSSSSSYVCDVCGHVESGYDCDFSDLGFAQCPQYHIVCEEHVSGNLNDLTCSCGDVIRIASADRDVEEWLDTEWPTWRDDTHKEDADTSIRAVIPPEVDEDDVWGAVYSSQGITIPTSCCPICTMKSVSRWARKRYLMKLSGFHSEHEVDEQILETFNSYEDLSNYLSSTSREEQ